MTWLNLSNNELKGKHLTSLSPLRNIIVLNISHNKIKSIPIELKQMLYNVKAFIANNNEIVIPVFLQYLNVFFNILNL